MRRAYIIQLFHLLSTKVLFCLIVKHLSVYLEIKGAYLNKTEVNYS